MESKGGNMETINREQDIGYLVSFNGTILPIRPIRVKEKIGKNGVQYQASVLDRSYNEKRVRCDLSNTKQAE